MYEIQRTLEFDEWVRTLDTATARRVNSALYRMSEGNWGDYKPLPNSPGIFERRLKGKGPGIRLYFCRQGANVVWLLTGGDKASQQRRDIAQSQRLRDQYL